MSNLFNRVRPFVLGAALAAVACAASAQVVPESLAGTTWTLAIQGSPPTVPFPWKRTCIGEPYAREP